MTCAHNIQVLHSMHQGVHIALHSLDPLTLSPSPERQFRGRRHHNLQRKITSASEIKPAHTVRTGYSVTYLFAQICLLVVNVDSLCQNKLANYLMVLYR